MAQTSNLDALFMEIRSTNYLAELIIPINVKILKLHETFLLRIKPALVESFEGRFFGCLEEEGVAGHEVHGGNVEANGFHYVP